MEKCLNGLRFATSFLRSEACSYQHWQSMLCIIDGGKGWGRHAGDGIWGLVGGVMEDKQRILREKGREREGK